MIGVKVILIYFSNVVVQKHFWNYSFLCFFSFLSHILLTYILWWQMTFFENGFGMWKKWEIILDQVSYI